MTDIRAEGRPLGVPLAGVPVPSRVARQVELARREVGVGEPQINPERAAGIECPDCGCAHWFTIQTRQRPKFVYRQKRCRHCGRVVSTTERITSGR